MAVPCSPPHELNALPEPSHFPRAEEGPPVSLFFQVVLFEIPERTLCTLKEIPQKRAQEYSMLC
jgi:hypothetical protein